MRSGAQSGAPGGEPDRYRGAPLGDVTGPAKTSGAARYVGDLAFDGLLEAGVVRSPWPHAEIVSIDLSAALAVEGVVGAVTGEDFGRVTYVGAGGALSDRPPMARGIVRFVGEEVVALAATSGASLARALPLVRVRYRRRRAVLSAAAALAPGAPRLHEACERGNLARSALLTRGAPRDAPAPGERALEARYGTGSQAHCCLETHTVVAAWPDEDGPVDLWAPTQGPLNVRREVAHVFGLAEERVRLHDVAIGGDFGARVKVCTSEAIAVALARRTRRPVRLRLDRAEEFAATKRRYPFDVAIALRATAEGRLTRLDATVTCDLGAYHGAAAGDFSYFPQALSSLYAIESVAVAMSGVYTNQGPPGSFRGAGAPQAAFARECALDELARSLGLDPFEIRLTNLEAPEAAASGWRLDGRRMAACLERARAEIGRSAPRAGGEGRRGIGVAAAVHVTGVGPLRAEAVVELDEAGTVTVRSASADPGTGQRTVLAQVAAHELGLHPRRILVVLGETAASPFDPGLGASKGSYVSANAVGAAARDLAERLRAAAAAHFAVNEVTLDGGFARTRRGDLRLEDLVPLCRESTGGVLRGEGAFAGGRAFDDPDPSDGYAYAVQATEVEVDEALGTVRVLRLVSVHDSGRLLNPALARAQVEGGVMMGLGMALGEELVREGGRVANPNFSDYACPRAPDAPAMDVVFLESDDGPGRYASRGLAEICLAPTAAAVANAICDATGLRLRDLPITPDKIVGARGPTGAFEPRAIAARPGRWWPALVRALYPRGLHDVLDRWGPRRAVRRGAPTLERAGTLEAALAAMASAPGARPLGGGTDLVATAREGLGRPAEILVDVTQDGRMRAVARAENGDLHLGGGTTLADLARSELVPAACGLAETALAVASPQLRNLATLAGNLCQEKRCWFYRHDFDCYKRSGPGRPCYAVEGDHRFYHAAMAARRCQAITPSDLATTLGALDAAAIVQADGRRRIVPVVGLYSGPGETILAPDEILTEIVVPAAALARSTAFRKLSLSAGGFAVCAAAASLSLDARGDVAAIKVVLGGIAPVPIRLEAVEAGLVGDTPTAARLRAANAAWIREAHPLRNNAWKLEAAAALVARAVEAAHARALRLAEAAR